MKLPQLMDGGTHIRTHEMRRDWQDASEGVTSAHGCAGSEVIDMAGFMDGLASSDPTCQDPDNTEGGGNRIPNLEIGSCFKSSTYTPWREELGVLLGIAQPAALTCED